MPLIPLSDMRAADWFVDSDADWWTKVILGPPGFEAYARVLYGPDDDAPLDRNESIHTDLRDVLARHTTTPDDCFFALWGGWGVFEGGPQDTGLRYAVPLGSTQAEIAEAHELTRLKTLINYSPAFPRPFLRGPMVRMPDRDFYLFAGPLGREVDWGAVDYVPATYGPNQPEYR